MGKRKGVGLSRIGVSLPKLLLEPFDKITGEQGYSQRSEAIRDLIRVHIESHVSRREEKGNEIGVACYIIMKELQEKDMTRRIARCESDYRDIIKSVMPVVLSDKQIFMPVIVEGDAKRITAFSDAMCSLKGVVLVGYSRWSVSSGQ